MVYIHKNILFMAEIEINLLNLALEDRIEFLFKLNMQLVFC